MSNKTSIPNNRNGPSVLLLGEQNSSMKSASQLLSINNVQNSSCVSLVPRDEPRIHQLNVKNNHPPSMVERQQIGTSQNQQQPLLFDECMEFNPEIDRRVVIDDYFLSQKHFGVP